MEIELHEYVLVQTAHFRAATWRLNLHHIQYTGKNTPTTPSAGSTSSTTAYCENCIDFKAKVSFYTHTCADIERPWQRRRDSHDTGHRSRSLWRHWHEADQPSPCCCSSCSIIQCNHTV